MNKLQIYDGTRFGVYDVFFVVYLLTKASAEIYSPGVPKSKVFKEFITLSVLNKIN